MSPDEPVPPPRILIVDDEPLGRRAVARQVAREFPEAEVREAGDGFEALEQVASFAPTLIFLDVEMPELTGFDVLRQLPEPRPRVVFVTAYQDFALRAFEVNACDYLVKPFSPERFAAAAARVRTELDVEHRLEALERGLASDGQHMARLVLRLGSRTDVVQARDVSRFVSRGHYTYVYAGGREYLSELSLVHFEPRLDPARFIRVHRNALVNLGRIRRVLDGPPPGVELDDGEVVPLSRRNRATLLERLAGKGSSGVENGR